jgi:hypothetical protein
MRLRDAHPPPSDELSGGKRNSGETAVVASRIAVDDHLGRYVADRERILGRRLNVAYEPEEAGRDLIVLLGGKTMAWRWLTAVMKQVNR